METKARHRREPNQHGIKQEGVGCFTDHFNPSPERNDPMKQLPSTFHLPRKRHIALHHEFLLSRLTPKLGKSQSLTSVLPGREGMRTQARQRLHRAMHCMRISVPLSALQCVWVHIKFIPVSTSWAALEHALKVLLQASQMDRRWI